MRRVSVLAAVLGLCTSLLHAQQKPQRAPCTSADHHQFDFWVGDWEVTDSAGVTVYGANRIVSEENGCLIHENWVGSRGGTGQSLNFYDPQKQQWEQVWVGNDGLVLIITGSLQGNGMVLTGEATAPGGKPMMQRAAWTPQPDGRVRQFWQQSTDGGTTWTVAFDGWYRRKS